MQLRESSNDETIVLEDYELLLSSRFLYRNDFVNYYSFKKDVAFITDEDIESRSNMIVGTFSYFNI